MLDAFKRALGGGDPAARRVDLEAERGRLLEGIEDRRRALEALRGRRLEALFPSGAVEGFVAPEAGGPRFPGLDPINLEEDEPQSWAVAVANRIVDGFPGGEALLSQLDRTWAAYAEANWLRVVPGGPHGELLAWRDQALAAWDVPRDVPLYLTQGGGHRVYGCKAPFVVLDLFALAPLDEEERRFVVASSLGPLFFGYLRIFAFHRLMEVIDKMPSVSGLVAKGLGLIPVLGHTISRGLELARSLNDQLIRKTNLIAGVRQHVLCDRLAVLALGDPAPARRAFAKIAVGAQPDLGAVHAQLVAQGAALHARLEQGDVDLQMLSVIGPGAPFAAYRAHRLDQWLAGDRADRLRRGYFVTRERLAEYRRADAALEDELRLHQQRLLELHERLTRVEADLLRAAAAEEPAG